MKLPVQGERRNQANRTPQKDYANARSTSCGPQLSVTQVAA
jgi:hypothetical protein